MKMTFRTVNPNKLQDEFLKAGIKLKTPILSDLKVAENAYIANNAWCEFSAGTDMELVQQIIDAHDPTPLPQVKTQEDYLLDLDFRLSLVELGLI